MRHDVRGSVAGLLWLGLLGVGLAPAVAQITSPRAERLRLVLALSIDQMRFDYLVRFAPLFRSGFKTLLAEGAIFENARYRHSNCETGPGHSALLSGRNGMHSGIVANSWYDPALKRVVNVVDDPAVSVVGGKGRGASPVNFIGFTVGDMLKKRTPGSRVIGVSLKDRSAVLMAGPRADAAYWYEPESGNFVTSTYYMKTAPGWLSALNARRVPDSYLGKTWNRLLPDGRIYEKFAGPDDVKGEAENDTVFPHAFHAAPPTPEFYEEFRRTPFADELTLDVALEAMKAHALGTRGDTDLLAIGFSATDVIGHAFGPDSQEVLDQMLRLDVILGRLFDAIEAQVGLSRTLVALSADHSVMPLVENLKAQGIDARRVTPDVFRQAVARVLDERFPGKTGLVAAYVAPDVYLDLGEVRRQGLRRADVEAAVEAGLLATGVVARVYTQAQLQGEAPGDDPYFQLIQRSFFEPRSPHLTVLTKEYTYINTRPTGTGHGTAYDYDRHVPVAFMGPGAKRGRYAAESGPEDIAPTLGALLELDYPPQDAKGVLSEMFVAPVASGGSKTSEAKHD